MLNLKSFFQKNRNRCQGCLENIQGNMTIIMLNKLKVRLGGKEGS
jgi:hypothetical protein